MKRKWLWAVGALPLIAAGVAVMSPLQAADHVDADKSILDPAGTQTGVALDPAADITDVYAFTPQSSGSLASPRVVLVMNVAPSINTTVPAVTRFSDKVDYRFAVKKVDSVTPKTDAGGPALDLSSANFNVVCTANNATPQVVTCTGPNGLTKSYTVGSGAGTCTANDNICVWAGKARDPFYFDLVAFLNVSDAGAAAFKPDAGQNFFAQANVLSIVVEVDANKLVGADGGAGPILTVAGETTRKP